MMNLRKSTGISNDCNDRNNKQRQSDHFDYHSRYRAPGTFRPSRKPDPTPPARELATLTFGDKHNLCAYLDPTTKNGKEFRPMIEFLRRSRIYYAISNSCRIYRSPIQSFWESARLIAVDDAYVIEAYVLGQAIRVTEADIRRVLQFGGEPTGMALIVTPRAGGLDRLSRRVEGSRGMISFDN
ncbi:hypothetical protein E3N88_25867 [Mikania micrantha]|uniref:Uncharacterized protein n=1 Tax=Mikania micrantha TaxID=192012 RepID=A0A5N6N8R1_9ASTR|nr:hypothetical protein E3N88_25867 [Mikania micrantha]